MALILMLAISPSIADAAAVDELYADGNRLFRDDLYWAALLRYKQAEAAGLRSPQLYYNMGVAHYKANQHIRARESFQIAAESPSLQPYAHYNLGLNAWEAGGSVEALKWFRKARDQQRNEEISKLARKAIARLNEESVTEDLVVVRAQAKEKERNVSDFEARARIGGGVDSNVFRSPSEPYVDQSDPNLPVIVPEVQQGFYIPVSLSAKYSVHSFENESFFAAYRFAGRFYQDKALENGNEYLQEISFGTEYERRQETRRRQLFSAFTIAQHDEVYYDRDTGADRDVNDTDITDRFNYIRYGPELWFRESWEKLSLGFRLKGQLWNYEDTVEVPAYDHEYFLAGLNGQYRFTRTSLVRFTADAYRRHFSDRPSFDLDGNQVIGSPPVEYDYLALGITARQRVTRSFWFGVNYVRTHREDGYVGYNSYVKNNYGVEIHWALNNRFSLEASGMYQIYDYENAFAFQNPTAGRKTLERTLTRIMADFKMTPSLTLIAEYRYDDSQSNDTRIAYDRSRISLTVRWENY